MSMTSQPLSLVHLVRGPRQAPAEGTRPPLLLLLHGVGSNEYDLMGLADLLDPRFLVVSVRSPLTLGPGAYGWYPVTFTPQGAVGDTRMALQGKEKVIGFIQEAVEAYGADPKRVYLMGFSQGAIMSLMTGLARPDLVRGIVAMSGRLLPESMSGRADDAALSGLPIMVVHGTEDPVLTIADGRAAQAQLSTLPVSLTYKEYGMGHHTSSASMADIARWLTNQLNAA